MFEIFGKLKMLNAARGLLGGKNGFDMGAVLEIVEPFLTPENVDEGLTNFAKFINEHESKEGRAELAYLVRRTPDSTSVYVDVIAIENGMPVATVAQYNKANFPELLKMIKDAQHADKK